jgi:HAD superfamily hydrolase (TIGR01509 family)
MTPDTTLPDGRPLFVPMPLSFVPAAAIFDCDGTLADTMPLHYRAWREILNARGCPFPEEQFYAWGGVTALEVIERLNREHGLSIPPRETAEIKEALYARLLPEAAPIPVIVAEARRLHSLCPLAVASGGMRYLVEQTLDGMGIRGLFGAVTTADDVPRGKPAPDVFLLAAERLAVDPARCVVYEDGPAGMDAGRAAGMQVVDVRPYV